jgi:hypothetical protein
MDERRRFVARLLEGDRMGHAQPGVRPFAQDGYCDRNGAQFEWWAVVGLNH